MARAVIRGAAIAALLITAACNRSRGAAPPTASAVTTTTTTTNQCNRPHVAGLTGEHFEFDGKERTYQLYVPATYDGTGAAALVFDFHGYGSSAEQQLVYGDFRPLADRDGFLIVAPDGQGASRHYNLTGDPGLQDDVAMVGALLDHMQATFCVDNRRVYATGMSDGGAMSSVLACRSADRFAAFGPVAVVVNAPGCGGGHGIALMAFAGTADPIVPFDGGQVRCCGHPTLPGAPAAMAAWAAHDGCDPTFADSRIGSEVRRRTWSGCDKGEIVLYIVDGGGHTWPGSIPIARLGMTTTQINASQTLWDFFRAHPLAE